MPVDRPRIFRSRAGPRAPRIYQLVVELDRFPGGKPLFPELPNRVGSTVDRVDVQHTSFRGVQLDFRVPDFRQLGDGGFRAGAGGEFSELVLDVRAPYLDVLLRHRPPSIRLSDLGRNPERRTLHGPAAAAPERVEMALRALRPSPGLVHRPTVKAKEDRREQDQEHLIQGTRDRQESYSRDHAEGLRDALVSGEAPDGRDGPQQERPNRTHAAKSKCPLAPTRPRPRALGPAEGARGARRDSESGGSS